MASAALRPRRLDHAERVSLVEHLGELRARLIVVVAALSVAFGFCLWQNHALLRLVNRPLAQATRKASSHGRADPAEQVRQASLRIAASATAVAAGLARPDSGLSAGGRRAVAAAAAPLTSAARELRSATSQEARPVTLGIGEPFTATLTVSFIFALVVALPVVLYEVYAFMLPAVPPDRQAGLRPLLVAVPLLFMAGVGFGYAIVLPAAVKFFQGFNRDQFMVLVQAGQYYRFAATTLLAMGVVFQVPVGVLAATRGGLVTPKQLRAHRRYAVLACAAVAAFLPGDLTTLALETVPLYLLFEGSLVLASLLERRGRKRARSIPAS